MILTILYALIGFIILVFVHELGHFVFARLGKVGVEEFAVGMGKAIFQKKHKNTLYRINIFPIGGYCKLKGQSDFGPAEVNLDKDNFFSRPPMVRFLVSFGGPFFSYLLGLLFLTFALFFQGETKINTTRISTHPGHALFQDGDEILSIQDKKVSHWQSVEQTLAENHKKELKIVVKRKDQEVIFYYTPNIENPDFTLYSHGNPQIKEVLEKSPAQEAGIKAGDQILFINDMAIEDEMDLKYFIQTSSLPLKIKVLRETQTLNFEVGHLNTQNNKRLLGITFHVPRKDLPITQNSYSFGTAFSLGFKKSFDVISMSYKGIVYLIKGDIQFKENVSGPIQIFSSLGQAGSGGGFFNFLSFAGFISLALAFFNFLPFPALDGGHMVISLIEAIFRKRINVKVINALQIIGITFLLGMILFVTFNDIVKMIK